MSTFKIKNRIIGEGYPAYIIAEMSANHAGSIERAKEIIRAAKAAGADCVKIQTYTPDTLTIDCDNEYFAITEGTWKGENLYGLYGKAYTPLEWQAELYAEAKRIGIDFFSTPFDNDTADFLEDMGMEFYKIASFEMIDLDFLRHVAAKQKPMIVSTGMSTLEEMKEAVNAIYETGNRQLALLKCSSAYPAVSDEMNLKTIQHMKEVFDIPIGLSDHSMGSLGAVTAVALGACIIEKHFCLGREIENPDASFSMTPEEFRQMVEDVRAVERAMGKPTYGMAPSEKNNMVFRRSLFAVKDIKAGEVFTSENIRSIRPGYGLKPKFQQDLLTMTAGKDIKRGEPLSFEAVQKGAVLFLTNNSNTDSFYNRLKACEEKVYRFTNKLTLDIIKAIEPSFVISFNYKHIVPAEVLDYMKGRIVNLHTSYLPYNKGAAPNFFSFYEDTPKGVTIHEMAPGLDEGAILLQRLVEMKAEEETFASSYDKLMMAMEKLFFEHWDALKAGNVKAEEQVGEGTYHTSRQLKEIRDKSDFTWNENIAQVLDRVRQDKK
ncbi:MAG: pseudaminic acid synthase [Lachnospiraceae bacterium]|nr:pseudaminic acid synthase [Lachnospiraceae bacterium]